MLEEHFACLCLFVCKPLHEGKDLVALEWCLVIGWKCQRDSGGLEYGTTYLIAKVTIFLIFVWFSSQVCHHRESCLEFDASVFSQKCCWFPSFGNHLHKKQQIFGVGLISTFLHTLCACSSWQNVADLGQGNCHKLCTELEYKNCHIVVQPFHRIAIGTNL